MSKYGSVRPADAPPKKMKRIPQPLRGAMNWLNEESAAAREDYKKLRNLRKNPKY